MVEPASSPPRELSGDELMTRLSRFGRVQIRTIRVIGKVGGAVGRDMGQHPWKAMLAVNPLTPGTELVVPPLMVAHWAISRNPEDRQKLQEIRDALFGRLDADAYREAIHMAPNRTHATIDGWKLAKLVWRDTKSWAREIHDIGRQQVGKVKGYVHKQADTARTRLHSLGR